MQAVKFRVQSSSAYMQGLEYDSALASESDIFQS
jgi:hypothetical protein